MKKTDCPFCNYGEAFHKFGYLAFETETSAVIVSKDQMSMGRMIVAYKKKHVADLMELSENERNAFMKDVTDVAKAIQKAYHPNSMDYIAYGSTLGHLHFYLSPIYKEEAYHDEPFEIKTENFVEESVCQEVARKIIENYEA